MADRIDEISKEIARMQQMEAARAEAKRNGTYPVSGIWQPVKANISTDVALAHLPTAKPVINWQPKTPLTPKNPLPLIPTNNTLAMDETTTPTTKDAWFPVTLNLPGANTQTPEQTAQALEEEKRRRMLWIGGGVLAALILLTVVLAMRKN